MPSGECHEAGKRFLKVMYYIMFIYFFGMYEKYFHLLFSFCFYPQKKSKPLKPDPIHLGTLEEQGEEDKMNFLLNNTREIVKVKQSDNIVSCISSHAIPLCDLLLTLQVCLTGLGDVQGKEDIAVLDRENKFLLTPEREAVRLRHQSY